MSQIKLLLVTVAVCLVVESAGAAVYKITDYGARADGTTDCSPAISAANLGPEELCSLSDAVKASVVRQNPGGP